MKDVENDIAEVIKRINNIRKEQEELNTRQIQLNRRLGEEIIFYQKLLNKGRSM